jgi:hypothetical protein
MAALAEILDGFAAELELERELGVRLVELDRSLLCPVKPAEAAAAATESSSKAAPNDAAPCDFAFLHHRMLSNGGVEMMAKIVTAMKKTPESAPIVFTGERPNARIYVVLGGAALKMWFPELHCSPGQWAKGPKGEDVLVTYSPEFILRMGDSQAVKKVKLDMWTSLKGVMKRL